MRIGIVYKYDALEFAKEVGEFVREMGFDFELHHIPSRSLEDCDIIITVGGDGTILRTLQELRDPPPIFGINMGRIGILSSADPKDYKNLLTKALNNELEIEEFMRIECVYKDSKLVALNEIAVLSATQARLIEFEILINDVSIETMRADGAIFSTPIGSTAYSLSAGGPIVDPSLEVICFVPVSPFKLGWRPWIFCGDREIRVRLIPIRDGIAIADGNKAVEVEAGSEIRIRKAEYPARFFKTQSRLKKISEKIRRLV